LTTNCLAEPEETPGILTASFLAKPEETPGVLTTNNAAQRGAKQLL